ncbi:hypothetical protein BDZ89DRAFT_1064427 [Hymenopellis radicata]|nr:hypothetical protein BDZ89DRAFT_1064427 [Hymenopellis radicata]
MSILPSANLHLRGLYDTTVEFFALRSPGISSRAPSSHDHDSDSSPHSRTLTPVPDPIARLTRECASLRERLDAADGRQDTCTCSASSDPQLPPMSIRRDLEDARRELSQTKTELSKLEARCRMLERTLKETKALLKARDAEISARTRSNAEKQHNGGARRGFEANGAVTVLAVDEQRALTKSSEVFMTKTDSWSGAQVLQAVQDLNSEILQFAAAATELSSFDKKSHSSSSSKATHQAVQETASRLGPNLARILSSRDHSQDPMLVQLALQGCISTCVARALTPFCMGFPSKPDGILSQIYAHMYMAESQPTSSRWRALTHRHIHTMYPYLNDYSINELSETMYRWSSDILFIAGCPTSDRYALSTRDGMRAKFGDQIKRISRTVSHLAQVTREEIMSTRFEIVAIENDGGFDSRRMMDAFGEYGSSRGAILITTEVGLRCSTRKDIPENAGESGSAPVPEVEQRLLLQPKVVLDSVVDLIDPK